MYGKVIELEYEKWYQLLDQSATLLMADMDCSYLESLLESVENLNDGQAFVENGKPSQDVVQKLNPLYEQAASWKKDPELIRKGLQLALLKGMKLTPIQANHQITPDSIGTLLAFLVELIVLPQLKTDRIKMIDLAVGTGNLLYTVNNYLTPRKKLPLDLVGIDSDDLLLALASAGAALQDIPVQLFYQDALTPILIEPAHIALSDLPVGNYPLQANSPNFELTFEEDLAYTHFLMVEQHLNYLADGGFGLFLLPARVFEDDHGKDLLEFIQNSGDLLAMIQLPQEFFADASSVKTILLMRKHAKDQSQDAPEVFVGQVPNFKQMEQMQHFIQEIVKWNQQFN